MLTAISKGLFALYALCLPISMAGMELFSWLCFLSLVTGVVVSKFKGGSLPRLGLYGQKWLWAFWIVISIGAFFVQDLNSSERLFIVGEGRWILLLYGFTLLWPSLFSNYEKYMVWGLYLLILVSLYSISQAFTGFDYVRGVPFDENHKVGDFFRGRGFFHSTMTYSYSFGMLFCFTAAFQLLKVCEKPFVHRLLIVTNIFLATSLILTFTRGLWIALVASVMVMLYFYRRSLLKIFTGLGLLTIVLCYLVFPTFQSRVLSIVDTSNKSNNGRFEVWRANIEMIKDKPLLGVGYRMNSKFLEGYYEKLGIENGFKGHAHNNYLQIFAGAGVFGILTYLGFCFSFFIVAWRLWVQSDLPLYKSIGLGAMGAQVCMHIGGITQVNFTDGEVNHMFVFLMALMLAFYGQMNLGKDDKFGEKSIY